MSEILGKWRQPQGQPFPGLYFEFHQDGTFLSEYEEMEITSSGTYTANEGLIDIEQLQNTLGLLGKFLGLYAIQGDILSLTLGDPACPRPGSLEHENKRLYKKVT
jgi:hypothetical protein